MSMAELARAAAIVRSRSVSKIQERLTHAMGSTSATRGGTGTASLLASEPGRGRGAYGRPHPRSRRLGARGERRREARAQGTPSFVVIRTEATTDEFVEALEDEVLMRAVVVPFADEMEAALEVARGLSPVAIFAWDQREVRVWVGDEELRVSVSEGDSPRIAAARAAALLPDFALPAARSLGSAPSEPVVPEDASAPRDAPPDDADGARPEPAEASASPRQAANDESSDPLLSGTRPTPLPPDQGDADANGDATSRPASLEADVRSSSLEPLTSPAREGFVVGVELGAGVGAALQISAGAWLRPSLRLSGLVLLVVPYAAEVLPFAGFELAGAFDGPRVRRELGLWVALGASRDSSGDVDVQVNGVVGGYVGIAKHRVAARLWTLRGRGALFVTRDVGGATRKGALLLITGGLEWGR